jgi:acetyltransferase-like isoleucine patch superfamily enzyme
MFTTREKGAEIRIGDNCGFSGVRIRADLNVIIGNNVRCGANVLISDTDAHTEDPRAGKNAPVVIDENVWLGMNVMVLKGVHIGKNSVIGAGSVVTRDIPANVMAAGIPCRVIKELNV